MKYFILSIDDGTIYDEKVVEILDKHGIKGTFNLNSGLDDYVWYSEGRPVRRLALPKCKALYHNHEVASHSLTHPHMTGLSDDHIGYEAGVDKENLGRIFEREAETFAFPFEDFDERCIARIAMIGFSHIRLSRVDPSFRFPADTLHIPITCLDIKQAIPLFDRFLEDPDAELFVFVSHGYDFEFGSTYDKLDLLCDKVANSEVQSIYMRELKEVMDHERKR